MEIVLQVVKYGDIIIAMQEELLIIRGYQVLAGLQEFITIT